MVGVLQATRDGLPPHAINHLAGVKNTNGLASPNREPDSDHLRASWSLGPWGYGMPPGTAPEAARKRRRRTVHGECASTGDGDSAPPGRRAAPPRGRVALGAAAR